MARFRLKPPRSDPPGYSRPILTVRYAGESRGYATFCDGGYEFEISDDLYDQIVCDEARVVFEMKGDQPVAISIEEVPKT